MSAIWIEGVSRSGKSTRALEVFQTWVETQFRHHRDPQAASQTTLVLCVNAARRREFVDRLAQQTAGRFPVRSASPISFFRDEVLLFWPLLVRKLPAIVAKFPIELRVETEQQLAMERWQAAIAEGRLWLEGASPQRLVRRLLDTYLLAAYGGISLDRIASILAQGIEVLPTEDVVPDGHAPQSEVWEQIGLALQDWRDFCWQHGLLTYGIITELYGQYLLPLPEYQCRLRQRFRFLIADDVDEFPAIARDLCAVLLAGNARAVFTYTLHGGARLGLGADPAYWHKLAAHCEIISLPPPPDTLGFSWAETIASATVGFEAGLAVLPDLPAGTIPGLYSLETISRAKLLRQVAETIAAAIAHQTVAARDIAIIAPGLDDIATYALVEILSKKGIVVMPLDDQRPLSASAQVRALLTLLAFTYPTLARTLSRDRVAEMLVALDSAIDPVRAGLLADRCYIPDEKHPQLLPVSAYAEWNRIGYGATAAYERLRDWLAKQMPSAPPLLFLDRAIQYFIAPHPPTYAQIAALQALIETAQHAWELGYRLDLREADILLRFVESIRQGTVTANPVAPTPPEDAVTLASIYQYRLARGHHRWQFWLDASSPLWGQGGAAALFAAPLFLHDWSGCPWAIAEQSHADRQRLDALLRDLLYRTDDRVYLCYSELATNGQNQSGPLQALVDVAEPLVVPAGTD